MSNNDNLQIRFQDLFSKANLFVLSGPSGSGKSTIAKALLASMPELTHSVSITTRPPRKGEILGQDYIFVSREDFDQLLKDGQFLEHAEVYGNLYGTSKKFIEGTLSDGKSILLDIDICGVKQLRHAGLNATYIYILPPSIQTLETRLKARETDSEEVIKNRLAKFEEEIADITLYDFVVFNAELETSINQVKAIITAQKHRILK